MLSSTQLVELFIILFIVNQYHYVISQLRTSVANAQAKAGPVRPDTVPTRLFGLSLAALQVIGGNLIPIVYLFTVVGAGLRQPQWMNAFALPEVIFGVRLEGNWKNALRMLPCFIGVLTKSAMKSVFEHLGDQYHPIGRRQKPRVVQTGPYAWVRHPLYTLGLLQVALQPLLFWSYVPLFALVATVVGVAIKIPIEEKAIQRDDAMREEYRAYMRKVPAKVVPYVW